MVAIVAKLGDSLSRLLCDKGDLRSGNFRERGSAVRPVQTRAIRLDNLYLCTWIHPPTLLMDKDCGSHSTTTLSLGKDFKICILG
jgi:hypothetical protein